MHESVCSRESCECSLLQQGERKVRETVGGKKKWMSGKSGRRKPARYTGEEKTYTEKSAWLMAGVLLLAVSLVLAGISLYVADGLLKHSLEQELLYYYSVPVQEKASPVPYNYYRETYNDGISRDLL